MWFVLLLTLNLQIGRCETACKLTLESVPTHIKLIPVVKNRELTSFQTKLAFFSI